MPNIYLFIPLIAANVLQYNATRWALIQEKEDKGLRDFSGPASDDLEERLQVVCLPKLSRGVVYDVKEVGRRYGACSQHTCGVAASRIIARK